MKPPPVVAKLMDAGQRLDPLAVYVAQKAIELRVNLGFGIISIKRDAAHQVAETMRSNYSGKGSEARHIVFSTPVTTLSKKAIAQLWAVAADWLKTYAPDRRWIAGIHTDKGHTHLHLGIENKGPDGKALKIRPHQVLDMAGMKFTTHASSAQGIGHPGLKIYTKTRKPLVATQLHQATKEQINEWIQSGKLGVGRINKKGDITSVSFLNASTGKRINVRLDTIQRLAARAAAQAPGTGGGVEGQPRRDTGLARPGRQRTKRQHHGSGSGRSDRDSLGTQQQPDSPINAPRRPVSAGLRRDKLLRPGLATQTRVRTIARTHRPIATAFHGIGRAISSGLIALDQLGNFNVNPIQIRTKGK